MHMLAVFLCLQRGSLSDLRCNAFCLKALHLGLLVVFQAHFLDQA